MKKFFIILVLFITCEIYANEYINPMTIYKDNYILAGNNSDQVKLQFSAQYSLVYKSGAYFGYTQLSNWMCYKQRDTFITMYSPEAFYRFESGNNNFNNFIIPYIDYIQVSPINHNSTGVEGDNHRSINFYYGQIQSSIGDIYNIGFNIKIFGYYTICKQNKNINDYKKNYSADLFFKLKSRNVEYLDKEELHCTIGGNPFNKGFIQGELIFRIVSSYIQPKIMLQYYCGYDEYMIYYNRKDTSYRIGFIF